MWGSKIAIKYVYALATKIALCEFDHNFPIPSGLHFRENYITVNFTISRHNIKQSMRHVHWQPECHVKYRIIIVILIINARAIIINCCFRKWVSRSISSSVVMKKQQTREDKVDQQSIERQQSSHKVSNL